MKIIGINQIIETKKMEELYAKIVQKVDEMIPEEWKHIYIYMQEWMKIIHQESTFIIIQKRMKNMYIV